MNYNVSDTIVALSTPQGEGAIAVIRLSGIDCIDTVNNIFQGEDLRKNPGNTIHFGKIVDGQRIVDEVLVSIFRAPKSYTKENVVEISCHGSSYIIQHILQLCIRKGARQAERGEFTLRAFLNGQMDLSQAEAVADLIASTSATSHGMAIKQMRGGFSNQLRDLRQELIDFAALIELELDFGEEDVDFADRKKLEELIYTIQKVLKKLLDSFQLGNVIKNGIATVIAGRPNAGKSTLLNALLNEDRAIVSDIAGTTRDTIEEVINIRGIQFRLVDTAGIREAHDTIESIGVQKTMEKIASSTLIIYVFDVTDQSPETLWKDVDRWLSDHNGIHSTTNRIFVANKMDKHPQLDPSIFYKENLITKDNLLTSSAINKMNIETLKDQLYNKIISDPQLLEQTIVSNSRHYEALHNAYASLEAVLSGLQNGITGDFIAMDIRQALHHLGSITGQVHTDDLLDSIFGRFCIGK